MPTLKELKKLATQRKIKGRSKMNKAQLEAALGIKVKSRKSRGISIKWLYNRCFCMICGYLSKS